MKTGKDFIRKSISLFILVTYLFMASTYVLYLPKYNSLGFNNASISNVARIHRDNTANTSYLLLHRAFKSLPDNKRTAINVLIKMAAFVFVFIFAGFTLPGLIPKSKDYLLGTVVNQHYCRRFGILRI